jgi:arabinofuranan 3-O-arabinosyltransferase
VTTASPPRATYSLRLFAICAALTALALKQAPGQLVGDTKLDLAVDPMRLLSRAMHLWDPSRDFGLTQNQNYGYLFPMGPFFLLGKAIGLPPWAVQRLWWALLLCLAFVGLVKLADALGIGTATSRLLAGVAFALSPRILSTIGPISVESLPYCLAPWVLLPLVRGCQGGSPRRAAARSAVAVLCMGAVNAVAVLAALPPAVLWLLTRARGPRRRALAGWWVGCVLLATAWWAVPLLLLGRYSPPFLDYIETASTTTAVTSLVEVLRGTSDWIAYLAGGGGPTWPAGYALLTNRLVIAYTVVVLLAGLAGLLRRDLPERLWLTACLLLGVAAVTAGHLGHLSGALASLEHGQLDAALAPLRNVHKFDVVLRLPLALGLAHLVGALTTSAAEPAAAQRQRVVVVVAATAAVLGAALPAVGVGLAPRQPFVALPGYWQQTADWLAKHRADGRALLEPGSSFPDYLWGNSNDEPLQPLARSEWAVRSAIPLTPASTIRALDAVEQRLAAGQSSPGLADDLHRMGVAYVVVRNDLAYARAGSTRPLLVHEAVAGFPRVASFGPKVGGGNGVLVDEGLEAPYPAVEVFRVGAAPRAELRPLSDVVVVTGGAEAVSELDAQQLLGDRPVVLAQDAVPALAANPRLTTDTLRRREVAFGQLNDNRSQTLTAREPFRIQAPAHDYLSPGDAQRQTVARYIGARRLSASSSASDADAFGGAFPEHDPYAAVDGDVTTSWRSDPGKGLTGAQWRVDFPSVRSLAGVTVQLGGAPGQRPPAVRVTTSAGSMLQRVDPDGRFPISPADSSFLQLTAISRRSRSLGSFDVAEVAGLGIRRTLDVPISDRADVIVLSAAPGGRPSCYSIGGDTPLCSTTVGRRSEDSAGLDRTLHVNVGGGYSSAGTATPVPGQALDALLDAGSAVTVLASSSAVADPDGRPGLVVDGNRHTGWRAAPGDADPTLTFTWRSPHTLTGLTLVVDPKLAASRPESVRVTGAGIRETASLDARHHATFFTPIRTTRLTVQLQKPKIGGSVDPYAGVVRLLPVGVSEIAFDGAGASSRPKAAHLLAACGSGPTVAVGGVFQRTSVVATREQLTQLAPVPFTPCQPVRVGIGAGTEVVVPATDTFTPTSLTLTARTLPPTAAEQAVSTPRWSADRRRVRVPARSAPTLLQVHENTNAGWVATLRGVRLQPVVVDGWQQGWVVPAGAAGVVHLDYTPDSLYRGALLTGGVLALLVLLLGLVRGRVGSTAVAAGRTRPWHVLVLAGVLALIGGPVALALAAVAAFTRRLPERVRGGLAVTAVGLAGALLVLHPWARAGYAGRGAATQALCLIGLAVLWSALLRGDGITAGRLRQVISGRSTKR